MVRMLLELEGRLRRAIEENHEAAQRLFDKTRRPEGSGTRSDVASDRAGPDSDGS